MVKESFEVLPLTLVAIGSLLSLMCMSTSTPLLLPFTLPPLPSPPLPCSPPYHSSNSSCPLLPSSFLLPSSSPPYLFYFLSLLLPPLGLSGSLFCPANRADQVPKGSHVLWLVTANDCGPTPVCLYY